MSKSGKREKEDSSEEASRAPKRQRTGLSTDGNIASSPLEADQTSSTSNSLSFKDNFYLSFTFDENHELMAKVLAEACESKKYCEAKKHSNQQVPATVRCENFQCQKHLGKDCDEDLHNIQDNPKSQRPAIDQGDGHCGFRAWSRAVFGLPDDQSQHGLLRHMVAVVLRDDRLLERVLRDDPLFKLHGLEWRKQLFLYAFNEGRSKDRVESWKEMVNQIESSNPYMDELEERVLGARFGVTLSIWTTWGQETKECSTTTRDEPLLGNLHPELRVQAPDDRPEEIKLALMGLHFKAVGAAPAESKRWKIQNIPQSWDEAKGL
eukprot:g77179.t1